MHISLETLKQVVESWGYVMVFLGIGLESTGIPFPGETILLVAAAIAASSNDLQIGWVIFFAAAGAIAGDSCGYWIGRKLGRAVLVKIAPKLHFDAQKQAYLEHFFEKHGAKTIFIGRFIALLRAWAAFFAGLNRMHYSTFLLYNALGGIVWAVSVGLLGYLFGAHLPMLEKWLGNFSYILLGLVVVAILGFVFFWRRRQAKRFRENP